MRVLNCSEKGAREMREGVGIEYKWRFLWVNVWRKNLPYPDYFISFQASVYTHCESVQYNTEG